MIYHTQISLIELAKLENKKAGQIVKQINEVVMKWPFYAEQTNVESKKRDAITSTLVTY